MPNLAERIKTEGTPLFDPVDDQTVKVTFVWQGADPVPKLMGDFNGWNPNLVTLEEVEPEIWAYSLDLPADAYVEYSFFLKPDIEERYPDPFNPRKIWNGVNGYNNYFGGPAYTPTPLTRRGPGVKRGTLSEHFVETAPFLGDSHRQVVLYRPPLQTDQAVPLVVVWDGPDYLHRANLNAIIDNLIAEGSIRPVALAFIANGGSSRFVEYAQGEAALFFALEKVFPLARQEINLLDESGAHGILGASMGGLMALYGGLRYPKIFGHVLSQSGAFWVDDPAYEMLIIQLVRQLPTQPLKIWQDVGKLEGLLDGNRVMNALLNEKGYNVRYTEYNGGHNYTMWANYVAHGLKFLYGK